MEITNTELAEREFAYVADQLTTDELTELDRRVVEGEIESQTYIREGCGCFYGTIALLRNPNTSDDGIVEETLQFIGKLVRGGEVTYSGDWYNTALENELFDARISAGDTPATNYASAWLHDLLSIELARRQATSS